MKNNNREGEQQGLAALEVGEVTEIVETVATWMCLVSGSGQKGLWDSGARFPSSPKEVNHLRGDAAL